MRKRMKPILSVILYLVLFVSGLLLIQKAEAASCSNDSSAQAPMDFQSVDLFAPFLTTTSV